MNVSAEWRMERPELARRESRRGPGLLARTGLAVLGALVLAGGVVGLRMLYEKLDVPIAVIGVDGRIANLSAREVEDIVAANLSGGFLSLDLDRIREGLEAHPWVESATARRQWPNQLVIVIREETPIARWGDNGFLNNRGQTLDVSNAAELADLPLLAGPPGKTRFSASSRSGTRPSRCASTRSTISISATATAWRCGGKPTAIQHRTARKQT